MKVNLTEIEISNKNKELLRTFFKQNEEWIFNTDLLDYQNIKIFGNLLEKFMKDNNLENDYIFKLFLAEIRYDELAYYITKDCEWIKAKRKSYPTNASNSEKVLITSTINKWLYESKKNNTNYKGMQRTLKKKQKKL